MAVNQKQLILTLSQKPARRLKLRPLKPATYLKQRAKKPAPQLRQLSRRRKVPPIASKIAQKVLQAKLKLKRQIPQKPLSPPRQRNAGAQRDQKIKQQRRLRLLPKSQHQRRRSVGVQPGLRIKRRQLKRRLKQHLKPLLKSAGQSQEVRRRVMRKAAS